MVYSGYFLVYGIRFHDLHDLVSFFENTCYGTDLHRLKSLIQQFQDDHEESEIPLSINLFLENEGYDKIRVYTSPCWNDEASFYLGFNIDDDCEYDSGLKEYDSFENYKMDQQLTRMEKVWESHQRDILMEFHQLRKYYNASSLGENFDLYFDIKFYKFEKVCSCQ